MIDLYYSMAPASVGKERELLEAGATGVRLTFSYGTPEIQLKRAQVCKLAASEVGKKVFIIADLPGGGSRLAEFVYGGEGHFIVAAGESVSVTDQSKLTISEKTLLLPEDMLTQLKVGERLIIGDGVVAFDVEKNEAGYYATAVGAGRVENNRGVIVQGGDFMPACLTEKDRASLAYIADQTEFDAVALSFVSSAEDIAAAKAIVGDNKIVVAKIETPQGVESIAEIVEVADQIMVARGDLALTMPWQHMPKAVDTIVDACQKAGKPYIMATQVAESMETAPMMTRAEMTDLWQWKQRGVAGVLLSRETGWGERPVEAVSAVRTLLDTK